MLRNTTDRTWAVRRSRSGAAWRREAGDLYVSGLHALLREAPERCSIHGLAKTTKKRMVAKLHAIKAELRLHMHEPVAEVGATVLNQIYEEDFWGFSYGFRPGRADIRDFFGSISHEWMVKFLQHWIVDRRMLRLIKKWLRAGVSEDGEWSKTEVGPPQGVYLR